MFFYKSGYRILPITWIVLSFRMSNELHTKLHENTEILISGLLRVCPAILTHWDVITEPEEVLLMFLLYFPVSLHIQLHCIFGPT